MDLLKVNRDFDFLAPFVKEKCITALQQANRDGYPARLFEGFRTPERQKFLYDQGRRSTGKIVTNAKPWGSWHQFGLGVDIVYWVNGKWSWEGAYDKLFPYFEGQGFKSLAPQEMVHYEITGGLKPDEAYRIMTGSGLQALWIEIQEISSSRQRP
jgi:hypothetical protein